MTKDYGIEWKNPKEELPPAESIVLCHYKNSLDKGRYVIAFYAPKFTIEVDSDEEWYEYSEEKDNYYLPEGWYENVENADEYSSYCVENQEIIGWCPIPKYTANMKDTKKNFQDFNYLKAIDTEV